MSEVPQVVEVSREKSPEMSDEKEDEREKVIPSAGITTPPKQRSPSSSSSEGPGEDSVPSEVIEQKIMVENSLPIVHEPLIEQEVIDNQAEVQESLIMSTEAPVSDLMEEMIVKEVVEETQVPEVMVEARISPDITHESPEPARKSPVAASGSPEPSRESPEVASESPEPVREISEVTKKSPSLE